MNELANELEKKGFNTKIQGNKVSIRLGGLTNPVSVTYDLAKGRYVVGTRDLFLGYMYTLMLSVSLYTALISSNLIGALMVAACILGFTTLMITEMRVRPLREFIDQLNCQTPA